MTEPGYEGARSGVRMMIASMGDPPGRGGEDILTSDERCGWDDMRLRSDRLIASRSQRQRDEGYRLMDRQDAMVSAAWHRAARQGDAGA